MEFFHQHMDAGLQSAGGVQDGQEGAKAEHEADHVAGVMPAADGSHQDVAEARAGHDGLLTGLCVGVGLAAGQPGGGGHEQKHNDQDRKCA